MDLDNLGKLKEMLEVDAADPKGMKFDICFLGITEDRVARDCGTTGCAMGLAAISGKIPRLGFEMAGTEIATTIDGTREYYLDAAKIVFGFEYDRVARILFSPGYYSWDKREGAAGELEVAKRVAHLMRVGEDDFCESYDSLNKKMRYGS